jgi:hypothetical protein
LGYLFVGFGGPLFAGGVDYSWLAGGYGGFGDAYCAY